jgi:hypothetical protein
MSASLVLEPYLRGKRKTGIGAFLAAAAPQRQLKGQQVRQIIRPQMRGAKVGIVTHRAELHSMHTHREKRLSRWLLPNLTEDFFLHTKITDISKELSFSLKYPASSNLRSSSSNRIERTPVCTGTHAADWSSWGSRPNDGECSG